MLRRAWMPPLVVVLVAGCHGTPARLTIRDDQVVVNNRRTIRMPVRALDAKGKELPIDAVRYRFVSGDPIPLTPRGDVNCAKRGDAEVIAMAGPIEQRFTLRCRPVAGLSGDLVLDVHSGGRDSVPLDVGAMDSVRRPVDLAAMRVTIEDTDIAVVRDGYLFGRTAGETFIRVDIGDCTLVRRIDVWRRLHVVTAMKPYDELAEPPLALRGGEIRTWSPPPGHYEMNLTSTGALALGVANANCASYPDGPPHLSCITRPGSQIVVADQRPAGAAPPSRGALFLRNLAEPRGFPKWASEPCAISGRLPLSPRTAAR